MTRVLMTADAVGGVWTYCIELTRVLAVRGLDVVVAVLGPAPTDEQREELGMSGALECVDLGGDLEWADDPWAAIDASSSGLLDLAARHRADVVHLNGYTHAALPFGVPTVVVAHSDVASWWHAVRGCDPPPEWDEYRRRVAAGLLAATAIVAPTRAVLADLHRAYGVDRGQVIPNARADGWLRPSPKEPVVLGAGRMWDAAKNMVALDHAAAELDWPVVLAGDVGAPPSCCRHAVQLGPVPFDCLAAWLGRAAVFAAPARYEPFGLAALEAALAGCALVLGDIPSLREVWGDAAVFVDPADPPALARVLRELLQEPAECSQWGARARARARRYGPRPMGRSYTSLYESLLHRGAGS